MAARQTVCIVLISISLLGAGSYCSLSLPRLLCVVPSREAEAALDQLVTYSIENCSSYTLQHILHNHEMFFTSNTMLQLLPGVHEVNESFGSVIVRNVNNFSMIGTSCNLTSDNSSMPQSCCETKIECVMDSSLGISFLNSDNVIVSQIHITNCGARTGQLHSEFYRHYDLDFSIELLDVFSRVYSNCPDHTLLAAYSESITIDQMTLEHSTGACFVVIGVSRLILQHSVFWARCLVVALDDPLSQHTHSFGAHVQSYTIKNLSLMRSHGNFSDVNRFGLKIGFYHRVNKVYLLIHNSTFMLRNLLLFYYNKRCKYRELTTIVTVSNVTIIGNDQTCYGVFVSKGNMDNSCYERGNISTTVLVTNSQFFQSSIDIGHSQLTFQELSFQVRHSVELKQIRIQNVPCICPSALSAAKVKLDITSLNVTDSCCRLEALVDFLSSSVSFTSFGSNYFLRNRRTCIASTDTTLVFRGYTQFSDNVATDRRDGSTMVIVNSTLEVFTLFVGRKELVTFENNTGKSCGGIMARERSNMIFNSPVHFINNKGYDGGALALYERSSVTYSAMIGFVNTMIEFVGNSAIHTGGAVYIADEGYETQYGVFMRRSIHCALRVTDRNQFQSDGPLILFINNTALYSGSALFGGWIDICDFSLIPEYRMEFTANPGDPSVVSSNPSRVCVCIDSVPQCNITSYETEPLYPGQSFQVQAVAVGQRFGTTPSIVFAAFVNTSVKVDELQQLQSVDRFCRWLNYTVRSPNKEENLRLTVDRQSIPDVEPYESELLFQQLNITVLLLQCPLGYRFDKKSVCVCKEELERHGVKCDTETYSILRTKHQWINATFEHIDNTSDHGVLIHSHCPLDYCNNNDQFLSLESPSTQCNFNRSGVLCGSCEGNLSHIFGTNRCKDCSSVWALLVVPLFAVLGVALVAFIITLNLTVSQGTLSALIFYANIVSANQATFFPAQIVNTFPGWYIAWLNLDVGIEVCFIHNLDAYTKTWLQFLFPIYVWLLVILIIVSSRYSRRAARLSGENAVPALATLFLLSYTKLLRITITTFSSTQLVYPDGYIKRVWIYDGNVDFLEVKHAILFVAALLFLVVISVPYTLVLFTIQCLQRLPYHCLLSWVWKLKPLFDAHTGPYKEKHRYWPGLLLLVRVLLFLVFSVNSKSDPSSNLLVTIITTFCLFACLAYLGGVHKVIQLDVLEYIFLLNLGILSVATLYTRQTEGRQDKVIQTSVSITLFIFILVVSSHVYLKVKSTQKGAQFLNTIISSVQRLCIPVMRLMLVFGIRKRFAACIPQAKNIVPNNKSPNTRSSIELREPLMSSDQ